MAFRDPSEPIATCKQSDCAGCEAGRHIHCHFRPIELIHFLLLSLPPFIVGGSAVLAAGWLPMTGYLAVIIVFFGFVEIRVMCSHCPHYAEETATLGCWANHGSPKLWKYRPGPMSMMETAVFFGGLLIVYGYPFPFFLISGYWFLLTLYLLISAGFFMTLRLFLCTQCMNFACPLNSVPEAARALFFECNPCVESAWKGKAE